MRLWIVLCAIMLLMIAPASAQTEAASSAPVANVTQSAPSAEGATDNAYELGAGDRVRVTVFGEADLTGEYEIAANGTLAFPLVGEIAARGLTPQELSNVIAERLRAGFLREPRVASAVIGYRPFYILGEVARPGPYPYAADLDVVSAVAIAGGYTYRANRRRIHIRRLGETEERTFDLADRVLIRPGDTIRISERWF